ncbi:uncharacterized protein LOC126013846 [Suncus etruscus]|uniref:uncharacterized protein LOC126013846 n=1 Tax=Suncus etruscus TaxID=109475 RepID=UPI0021102767|nr:uncharacterized protein LOC126013846 [Suncus etruscus]
MSPQSTTQQRPRTVPRRLVLLTFRPRGVHRWSCPPSSPRLPFTWTLSGRQRSLLENRVGLPCEQPGLESWRAGRWGSQEGPRQQRPRPAGQQPESILGHQGGPKDVSPGAPHQSSGLTCPDVSANEEPFGVRSPARPPNRSPRTRGTSGHTGCEETPCQRRQLQPLRQRRPLSCQPQPFGAVGPPGPARPASASAARRSVLSPAGRRLRAFGPVSLASSATAAAILKRAQTNKERASESPPRLRSLSPARLTSASRPAALPRSPFPAALPPRSHQPARPPLPPPRGPPAPRPLPLAAIGGAF